MNFQSNDVLDFLFIFGVVICLVWMLVEGIRNKLKHKD